MSEQHKSSWDELAERIGATPRAQDEPKPSTPPAAARVEAEVEYKEPTRPASGWDSLLGEFGIAAPAPVSPPAPPTKPQAAPPQPKAVRAERQPEAVDAPKFGESRDAGSIGQASTGRSSARDVAPPEAPTAPTVKPAIKRDPPAGPKPAAAADHVEPAKRTRDQAVERAEATSQPEAATPPGARPSKWDLAPKSQLTLPDWFPFAGKRSKAPVAPPVADVEDERPAAAAPEAAELVGAALTAPDSIVDAPDTAEAASGDEAAAPLEKDGERKGRRRRSRGRRRRSGASASGESAAGAEEAAADADADADDADDDSFAAIDDEPSQDSDASGDSSELGEDDDSDDGSSKAKHRNVPTWSDALAVVIDANIAARSERKKFSTRSSGGNGRSRRGGRRRKKPAS